MENENEETRRQSPSEILREEIPESEFASLLSLLDIIEDIRRREHRPTYTSYYLNMAVNPE